MENNLYTVLDDYVNKSIISNKNRRKNWEYGYNKDHDLVVISKDGTIGDIYNISGLKVALPSVPDEVEDRGSRWKAIEYPKELQRIKSIFDWNRKDNAFKVQYVDYIENEFDRRDNGFWFINNGKPTYITGTHYMYLQWTKIDIGLPDFRESTEYFTYFGRHVRQTTDRLVCAT